MKLKDGHTYVTRSGVKRVVRKTDDHPFWVFSCKSICGDGFVETFTETGRFIDSVTKHPFDLVKEFKHAK